MYFIDHVYCDVLPENKGIFDETGDFNLLGIALFVVFGIKFSEDVGLY